MREGVREGIVEDALLFNFGTVLGRGMKSECRWYIKEHRFHFSCETALPMPSLATYHSRSHARTHTSEHVARVFTSLTSLSRSLSSHSTRRSFPALCHIERHSPITRRSLSHKARKLAFEVERRRCWRLHAELVNVLLHSLDPFFLLLHSSRLHLERAASCLHVKI